MRGRIIIAIFLVLVGAFAWTSAHNAADRPSVSALAPDFTWRSFDGKAHTLGELSGHAVVLHFWASWCAPCREEFPGLLKAASMNKSIVFLTISADEDRRKGGEFIRQSQAASGTENLPNVFYAFDPEKTISFNLFQTAQYPETILFDAGHHLRRKFPGPVDWGSEDIQNVLKQLR